VKFLLEGIYLGDYLSPMFLRTIGRNEEKYREYVENSGISSDQRLVGRIVSLLK
jgi:hypothetical protein